MPHKLLNTAKVNEVFAHLSESTDNRTLYLTLARGTDIAAEIKGLSLTPGYRIVRVDNRVPEKIEQQHFEIALVNDVVEEVVYYNRVLIQPDCFLNCKPVTQVLVWRNQKREHRAVLHELAGTIFLDYLLEKYDIIVSDMNQTHDGMSFWQARIYDAVAYGLKVYAYDIISCELRTITTEDDIGRQEQWLWGDPEHYQNRLAIISKIGLPVVNKAS